MSILEKLESKMKDIEYGYVDKSGKRHGEADEDFAEKYYLQSPVELLKSKLGVCWDQVELEREILDDEKVKNKTFFICYYDGDNCPTHTFIILEIDGKTYWYEHSWGPCRGIYEYKNEAGALSDIKARFIDGTLGDNYDEDHLKIYEYKKPRPHLSCAEFYAHCEAGKPIKV